MFYRNKFFLSVYAVFIGLIVALVGTLPWAWLVKMNYYHAPGVPWAVAVELLLLWLFWKYMGGAWWPRSNAEWRKTNRRAKQLPGDVWGTAIAAGFLGLIALVLLFAILNRMVKFPAQDAEELLKVPRATQLLWLLMGSLVAGVVEETAFRGYMQQPMEKYLGPVSAIFITSIVFGLAHFTHAEVSFNLLPFFTIVGIIYGTMASITKSILPGLFVHALGDVMGGIDFLFRGQSEWQTPAQPKPLIWETGADAAFWATLVFAIILTSITIWSFIALKKTMIIDNSE